MYMYVCQGSKDSLVPVRCAIADMDRDCGIGRHSPSRHALRRYSVCKRSEHPENRDRPEAHQILTSGCSLRLHTLYGARMSYDRGMQSFALFVVATANVGYVHHRRLSTGTPHVSTILADLHRH